MKKDKKDLKEDRIVLRVIAYMSFITSGILFYFWAKGNFEFTNPFFHFAIFTLMGGKGLLSIAEKRK